MRIVVSGSIAYDYLMTFPGRFTDQIIPEKLSRLSVSFLVDDMVRKRGGTAANIAYSLKLLGGEPILLGTVGQDFGDYETWLQANGIRTDHVVEIPHKFTASFFVSTDEEQNQIANFYAGAMSDCRDISLADRGLTDADVVIISPNDPQAMLNYATECRDLGIPFAYDPSQQTARLSGEALRASIPGAAWLMVNDYEFAVIQEKTGWSKARILRRWARSLSPRAEQAASSAKMVRSFTFRSRRRRRCRSRPALATAIAARFSLPTALVCRSMFAGASARCAPPMCWSRLGRPITGLRRKSSRGAMNRPLAKSCCGENRHRGRGSDAIDRLVGAVLSPTGLRQGCNDRNRSGSACGRLRLDCLECRRTQHWRPFAVRHVGI